MSVPMSPGGPYPSAPPPAGPFPPPAPPVAPPAGFAGPAPAGQPFAAPPPAAPPGPGMPPPAAPPGPGMPPPGPGMPGPVPPAKPRTGCGARVAGLVVTLVVVALIAVVRYAINYATDDGAKAEVGDCASASQDIGKSAEYEALSCSDPNAVYKVAKVLDNSSGNCPSGDYATYTVSQRRGPSYRLCLMLNVTEGECIVQEIVTKNTKKVSCTESGAYEVTKVVSTSEGDSACGRDDDGYFVYSEPPTTICLAEAS